ncbi:efflux RND transporter periplasmic adaptor subunit [Mastigocoleus testarum]|uniref:Secretion protein HylD n=1 Tax=Mastigocoleus testarum BC008 TaxID=371196 RepID=A0A0V7ZH61_9CYAN|nr:efflux RND transporter periplasmic adaptor subunit [Mastigocoleus testarum]KST63835.1 secretion protein HylD [Mastigocoleus testarum BC008]
MNFVRIITKGKTKFKPGVKWLTLLGIPIIISVGGWLVYVQNFNKSSDAIAAPVTKVKRSNVEVTINQGGTLELGNQQSLKAPGEVTVEKVLVKVRDRVKAGQQLLIIRDKEQQNSLDNKDLEIRKQEIAVVRNRQKVIEAQKKLSVAQKELQEPIKQELEIDKQNLTLARNRQKIAEAKEKLAIEKKKLKNLQALSARGFIPRDELERQEATIRGNKVELREAEFQVKTNIIDLKRLQTEKERGTQLKQSVLDAQSALEEARSSVDSSISELKRLRVERDLKAQTLKNNIVSAPIDAKILNIKVKDGNGVKPGDILLTLGNPAKEIVKLQLGTLDAGKVRVNQPARIKIIGPNSEEFTGKVQSIHPQAISSESSGGVSSGGSSSQAKVPATVKLDKPTGSLIPGSQVSVEIAVQQRKQVVAVNLEAVVRNEGKPFVWVVDKEGKARKINVTLGLEGIIQVEVKSGLKVGDKIITPTPDIALKPGVSIKE